MSVSFNDLNPDVLVAFSSYDEHEYVRRFELGDGIVAFIAVHNTNLGPALGGCRMRPYINEADAINDVLRLSRGMTYKNAMAGLPLGGGKAVIIGNPDIDKTVDVMRAMGQAVESFEGAYITAEDSGTGEADMAAIASQTQHVTGLPPEMLDGTVYGELGGNPSPVTALGCYYGIKAAVAHKFERDFDDHQDLKGLRISVQGLGAVGMALAELLKQDGAHLIVTDVSEKTLERAKEVLGDDIEIVGTEDIFSVDADIFVPCAMGGALNDNTIEMLKVGIVAGAANNQLLEDYHDKMLASRDILYVPDYVINSGGVICVGYEYFRKSGYNPQEFNIERGSMVAHVERIGQIVRDVLVAAQERGLPTGETADQMAEEKFLKGASLEMNAPADEGGDAVTQEESSSYAAAGGTKLVQ